MSAFPETSATLIQQIKTLAPGQDAAAWARFWDLYAPAMRQFAAWKGGARMADDIVMVVLGKLVEVLRSGQYRPEKGRFHSYLATMIYNEVHMQRRRDEARRADDHVPLDTAAAPDAAAAVPEALTQPPTAPEALDDAWRRAVLAAAVDHVLNRTALSDRDRAVYRQYAQEARPIGEVARAFGISRNLVSKIRSRIDARIAAVGREMNRLRV